MQALPFGGVKFSGFDRFAGPEGLRACCLMKSVVVDKFPSFLRTSIPAPLQVCVSMMLDRSSKVGTRIVFGICMPWCGVVFET